MLALCREMPFAAVARIVGLSWHRVHAICTHYVELALAHMDLSDVYAIAIDETSCRRGHEYLTLVVDMARRRVAFVTGEARRRVRGAIRANVGCAPRTDSEKGTRAEVLEPPWGETVRGTHPTLANINVLRMSTKLPDHVAELWRCPQAYANATCPCVPDNPSQDFSSSSWKAA